MTFTNEILTLSVVPQEKVSFEFSTIAIENQTGAEILIPRRTEYRSKITIEPLVLLKEEAIALRDFYVSVGGKLDSFLYKNQVNCRIDAPFPDKRFNIDGGVPVTNYGYLHSLGGNRYQLGVVYHVGIETPSQTKGYKTIHHPDLDNLQIYVDGNTQPIVDYTVSGGVVTVNQAVSGDLYFTGDYYLEYRFDSELELTKLPGDNCTYYQTNQIILTEVVCTAHNSYQPPDFENTSNTLTLPYEPEVVEAIDLPISEDELLNGRQLKSQRYNQFQTQMSLSNNVITQKEKNLLLSWFLAAKGRLLSFDYSGAVCRFDTDAIALTNLPKDECEYYQVDVLGLILKDGGTYVPPVIIEPEPEPESVTESDLVLWLDSSDEASLGLAGTTVTQWSDKSGKDNHAIVSYGSPQLSNGAIEFNGNSGFQTTVSFSGNNPRALFIVFKIPRAVENNQYLFNFGGGSQRFDLNIALDKIQIIVGASSGSSSGANGSFTRYDIWNVVEISYDGTSLKVYLNQTLYFSTDINVNTLNSTIGDIGYISEFLGVEFKGAMKAFLVYNRVLTEAERALNYNYLNTKL